jgi:hypothetical protein
MQISAPFVTGAARARTAVSEARVTIDPRLNWREIALSGVLEAGAAESCSAPSTRGPARISVGLRRLYPALPAMVGSTLLLSVAGSAAPTIGVAVVIVWIGIGVGVLCRPGERLAARTWLHVRPLSPAQERSFAPVLGRAVTVAGITVQDVDAYIHPGRQVNAYAFGGHSVALARGLIIEHRCGRLSDGEVVPIRSADP